MLNVQQMIFKDVILIKAVPIRELSAGRCSARIKYHGRTKRPHNPAKALPIRQYRAKDLKYSADKAALKAFLQFLRKTAAARRRRLRYRE